MYDEEVKTDIALIKQKIGFIEQVLTELKDNFNGIVTKEEFNDHVLTERWILGIIVTVLIGTLVTMFFN